MATYNGNVTGGSLNLRKTASSNATRLTSIPNGTQLIVSDYSENNQWYCTTYGAYSGFVMKQYITNLVNTPTLVRRVTGGGLNLRMHPSTSATTPIQIPNQTIVIVQNHNASWSSVTYSGYSGFVMSQYLAEVEEADTPNTDADQTTFGKVSITASTPAVNIRAEPSANGEIIGRLFDGDPLQFYTNEEYNADGYEWYRIMFDGDGYIQKRYVIHDNSNRSVVETYNFNLEDAVTYADNHTQNKSECTNYNNTFGISSGNDCANFISQCLCAGGLPMFDGWAKPVVSAIPSDWNDTQNWIYTNRSRCALIAKNRIYRIPHTDVKRGDIVYTYNSSESPNERYTHVVIVSEAYNSATQKCKVHGHTANQQNQDKVLTENNCRCYRVVETIKREACEVKLRLPVDGGSGATIY